MRRALADIRNRPVEGRRYDDARAHRPGIDVDLQAHFDAHPVHTPVEIDACQSLRYQVYCLERGFLDPAGYPKRRESDEYDRQAIHFASIARRTGELAGTVRIIPADHLDDLPIARTCQIDAELLPENRAAGGIAEISRLAISRHFRRRQNDDMYGFSGLAGVRENSDGAERRSFRPLIVLGLYAAYYRESKRRGITYWYAAMEPSLVRLLRRYGIKMRQIGPITDYWGRVAPYAASIAEMESIMFSLDKALIAAFADGLEEPLKPIYLRSPEI